MNQDTENIKQQINEMEAEAGRLAAIIEQRRQELTWLDALIATQEYLALMIRAGKLPARKGMSAEEIIVEIIDCYSDITMNGSLPKRLAKAVWMAISKGGVK